MTTMAAIRAVNSSVTAGARGPGARRGRGKVEIPQAAFIAALKMDG